MAQLGHGATFHIDHIVPRSKGGATALETSLCSVRAAASTRPTRPRASIPRPARQ
ncbi:HNH endonuclease [Polyangium aurulentum]|uniref:HNH endonuclease n=1 Tax=Polyangium aurulentum TaxID=2567896 RepID=UPI003B82C7BE